MEALSKLKEAVITGEEEGVKEYCEEALESGIKPVEIMSKALIVGMKEIGEKWVKGEVFLSDVLLSALVMKEATSVVEPEMQKRGEKTKPSGRVIIGTVKGDIHDLGKNLVAVMLLAEGFDVYDLGVDVPTEVFINKTRELKPQIIGLSALMTISMNEQSRVIEALKRKGLREEVKVIIGGAPITRAWAEEIGADGYAENAVEATKVSKLLLGKSG